MEIFAWDLFMYEEMDRIITKPHVKPIFLTIIVTSGCKTLVIFLLGPSITGSEYKGLQLNLLLNGPVLTAAYNHSQNQMLLKSSRTHEGTELR